MSEQQMRSEIEAAGMRLLQIGRRFGSELDAIVENDVGQFLWSAYRRETIVRTASPSMRHAGQTRRSVVTRARHRAWLGHVQLRHAAA